MISEERRKNLAVLEESLNYRFNEVRLLNKALTHKSYANESSDELKHNERFEFLGDSVLDLVVSEYTIEEFLDYKEGVLSKIRASVVNESCLAELARKVDLGRYLLLGKGERLSGGHNKTSLLANAFEAVAGSVYLDGGFESASKTFLPFLKLEIEKYAGSLSFRDYKSDLQEYTQNKMMCIPTYRVAREMGPDHQKEFEVVALIKGEERGRGIGRSKKEAEQSAAKEALQLCIHASVKKI
jgi:ribonuclease-3